MLSARCRIMCSPRVNTWEDTHADSLGLPFSAESVFSSHPICGISACFAFSLTFFCAHFSFAPQFTAFLQGSCLRAKSATALPSTMLRNALGPDSIALVFRDSPLSAFRDWLGRLTILGMLPLLLRIEVAQEARPVGKKARQGSACNSDRRSRIWAEEE